MKTLKLGSLGPDVKELQFLLISHDFKGIIPDGIFGSQTQKAVKQFQSSRGLEGDGIVGKLTMVELEKSHNIEIIHDPDIQADELDDRTLKYFKTLDPKAQKIFLPFIIEAKRIAKEMGYEYKAISGNRGEKEQNDLYAQGRTKPGKIVTNAKFGFSNHNWGCALDFAVFKDGKYLDDSNPSVAAKVHKEVSKLCAKYNLAWGGNWKLQDTPHFEIKSDLTMAQKREKFKKFGSIL